jgi:hypothetical protein
LVFKNRTSFSNSAAVSLNRASQLEKSGSRRTRMSKVMSVLNVSLSWTCGGCGGGVEEV